MAGYWESPEETERALEGGWLHTGDVATISPDGFLTIVDRKKDLIISGGENISSVEVENALAEHPAVLEAAVVGVPDERWGEVPRAFVVLPPGAHASPDELIAFVRAASRALQGTQGRAHRRRPAPRRHGQGAEDRAARRELSSLASAARRPSSARPKRSLHMPHFGEKNVSIIGCVASPPSASASYTLSAVGDVGGFVVHVDAFDAPVAPCRVVRSHRGGVRSMLSAAWMIRSAWSAGTCSPGMSPMRTA